ncbi:hypothetical protein LJR219_000971 [Phenylobacterium sp. LjRoot219]|uniref:hypothetical protein n=1 Tax=Phenylobacterium sp. LjRoot219 TaxID=3342283 RepID=UPI003ECD2645
MASKAPPIPPEQRAYAGQKPDIKGGRIDRRELKTGDQSHERGDADVNAREQGRQGNIWQNTHNQGYQQDR